MFRFDRKFVSILALSAATSFLIGCGQKGPLYLPSGDIDQLAETGFDRAEQESQVIGPTLEDFGKDRGGLIPPSR